MKKILTAIAMAALLCTTPTACGDDDCDSAGIPGGVTLMSMTDGKSEVLSGGKKKKKSSSSSSDCDDD